MTCEQKFLRAAIDHMSQTFAVYDAEMRLVVCNEPYAGLMPHAPAPQPGDAYADIARRLDENVDLDRDDMTTSRARINAFQRGDETPFVLQLRDGRVFQFISRSIAGGGRVSVGTDVTELIEAQAALGEARERAQLVADHVPGGICQLDQQGNFVFANAWLEARFGKADGRISGRHVKEVCGDEIWLTLRPHLRNAVAGGEQACEMTYRASGIEPRQLRMSLVPEFDETGRTKAVYGLMFDITERVRLEESLNQAQRMQAFGQLTGGFAHDFNNSLAAISGNLELAELAEDPAVAGKHVASARDAADKAAVLVHHLLTFARQQTLQPSDVSLNDAVTALRPTLEETLGPSVDLRFTLASDVWHCFVDISQLELALGSVAANAREAMDGGGTLTVKTANVSLDDAQVAEMAAGESDARAGDYVMIGLSDTGRGIPPQNMGRIFEPFFTTK